MWFTMAEGQFKMKGMQDLRYWFYTVLATLSAQQQDRVADIAGLMPVPAGEGEAAANAQAGRQPADRQAAGDAQPPRGRGSKFLLKNLRKII